MLRRLHSQDHTETVQKHRKRFQNPMRDKKIKIKKKLKKICKRIIGKLAESVIRNRIKGVYWERYIKLLV